MRMRNPVAVAATRTDRSIELVCLALVLSLGMLVFRIVSFW
jgi:hypothetical protein